MKYRLSFFITSLFICKICLAIPLFAERLCADKNYHCHKVLRGESWGQLFPKTFERDIVQRVNRMNIFLEPDMIIAIPNQFSSINDLTPLPTHGIPDGQKKIYVDLNLQAWGAYDEQGNLIKWGPISAGASKCLDQEKGCETPIGWYRVTRKKGADCVSNHFPRRINGKNGGGDMPYCIFFYRGYALHGSSELPGFASSYGCLRLFNEDAEWLNKQFVDLPTLSKKGTMVVIVDSN